MYFHPPLGGTLRVSPPRPRVLEIVAKFHPISWIGWGMDSLVMGSGLTVHDPGCIFSRDHLAAFSVPCLRQGVGKGFPALA